MVFGHIKKIVLSDFRIFTQVSEMHVKMSLRPKIAILGLKKFYKRNSGTSGQKFENLDNTIFFDMLIKTTLAKFHQFGPKMRFPTQITLFCDMGLYLV